jgi:site-specific recombinase XerD
VHDLEAFLATAPKARHRRLTVLHQFFRFASRSRLILIDPTTSLKGQRFARPDTDPQPATSAPSPLDKRVP